MMERIFGIMRRAYYLTAISIFAGCMLGYFFADWTTHSRFDPDLFIQTGNGLVYYEEPARKNVLVIGLVTPIIAVVAHKILHWIIWGKFK